MPELVSFVPGGYAFLEGGTAYALGVKALPGFAIESCRFLNPVPLDLGLAHVMDFLMCRGRPVASLCATELRSPTQMAPAEFKAINARYVEQLKNWGIAFNNLNPVARSNASPVAGDWVEVYMCGFSFTVESNTAQPTFVISGSPEYPAAGKLPESIYRFGEDSSDAIDDKAHWVLGAIEDRMRSIGVNWEAATSIQSYSEHNVFAFHAHLSRLRAASGCGIEWQNCRPPVAGCQYELDVKGVAAMHYLPV